MAQSWERNIWTGRDTLDISPNSRIIRQPYSNDRPLYRAEFWGDYSLQYPLFGVWRNSLGQAKSDLTDLQKIEK